MIIDLESLSKIRDKHMNETIVFAGGVFDLIHPGHIDLFRTMKQTADITLVAISSDQRVKERKGKFRPIYNELTRLQLVDAVKYVDYSIIAPEPDNIDVPTIQIIRRLRPDIFMSSDDKWLSHSYIFDELGIKFILVPRFREDISTTQTILKIQSLK